jgi:hypothetical protein
VLREFIIEGKVGLLHLSLSKQQCLNLIGKPQDWAGNDWGFSPKIANYLDSDIWNYYQNAAGIQFSPEGVAERIFLRPELIQERSYPFETWPFQQQLTMGALRNFLIAEQIEFNEGGDYKTYWIRAASNCFAHAFPYRSGHLLEPPKREVANLFHVTDPRIIDDLITP